MEENKTQIEEGEREREREREREKREVFIQNLKIDSNAKKLCSNLVPPYLWLQLTH